MSLHPFPTLAPLGAILILLPGGPLAAQAPLEGEALARADEAYRLQQAGDAAGALAATDAALRLAPGDRDLRLLKADLLLESRRHSEALQALEPLRNEPSYQVQSRLGYALLGVGRTREAGAAFRIALAATPDPGERRTAWSGLLDVARQQDDAAGELEALRGLRALAPTDPELAKETAYALDRAGRTGEALAAFRTALVPGAPPADYLDAAYMARKVGRDAEAKDLFTRAIQAQAPGRELDPATRFAVRREVEGLSRTWGGSLTTSYNQSGLIPGTPSDQRVVQQGAEVFYQPRWLTRGGRQVQFFLQAFENVYAPADWHTGAPTLQPSLGVRAKPFESQNLVAGVQRIFKATEDTPADWLYTLGYSAEHGVDLRGGESAWTYASLYTEAAWFQRADRYVQTGEARLGRSWRLGGSNTVLVPHAVLAGDYDRKAQPTSGLGAGPGLALRSWFRQSAAMAPASFIELSVQYRWKLDSADRSEGWFARMSIWF